VAVVVFDADVLIGFLGGEDIHHADAVACVRRALEPGTRRLICAVHYTEVLIGPLDKLGRRGAEIVDAMLVRFGIETIAVDVELAQRAASVRAQTKLKLPDAYALATALDAKRRSDTDVRIESFDRRVVSAYQTLQRSM
jgi:predicted nucleic acid-binding protein